MRKAFKLQIKNETQKWAHDDAYFRQWPGEGVTRITDLRGLGPQRALGGPGKTKSRALKGGPGRPNHALQKDAGKWYIEVSRLILGQILGNVRRPK
jgi:hypothetical protein